MAEQWKDVPGFEGELIASSEGRVARLIGFDYSQYQAISVSTKFEGHPVLNGGLSRKDDQYIIAIHRIIAVTFLGDPPNEEQNTVNHIDGNKENNRVENLEWLSRGENIQHAWRTGLMRNEPKKHTREQYLEARRLRAAGFEWRIIAERVGMSVGATFQAVNSSKAFREEANG